VHFSTTLGRVFPAEVGTVGGWATAVLTGTEVGAATVQAQAGAVQGWTEVALLPGPPAVILVTAEPTSLVADGVSTATVRASLADAWGHPVADGTPVAFTTSLGTVTPTLAWTEAGRAQAVLRSGREAGWARVQASSASAWGEVWVRFFLYRIYLPLVGRSGIGL
jgi:adhesin/invasin